MSSLILLGSVNSAAWDHQTRSWRCSARPQIHNQRVVKMRFGLPRDPDRKPEGKRGRSPHLSW